MLIKPLCPFSNSVGIYKKGRVEIIANDQGNRITPSYVAFREETGERLIGDGARNQVARNPENTVYDVKRLIGRTWDDESLQSDIKYFPFKVFQHMHNYKIKAPFQTFACISFVR